MKFTNNTKKDVHLNLHGKWVVVPVGTSIETSFETAERNGLTEERVVAPAAETQPKVKTVKK